MVLVIYSDVFYNKHRPWFYHPEQPERAKIAFNALQRHGLISQIIEPYKAEEEDLYKVHSKEYVEKIKKAAHNAPTLIDSDTYIAKDTYEAALFAAGAAMLATDTAYKEKKPVYAIVRPPGHHAGRRGRAFWAPTLGFCIFNNIAIATAKLIENNIRKVVIIDFDLHHGNGTQDIFYGDPRVIHIDLHQDPTTIYPGTGFVTDYGRGEAEGTKINIPLPIGSADREYKIAIDEIVIPVLKEVKPDIILYSAGFDAYANDGLGGVNATSNTFYSIGRLPSLIGVNRVVAILEGGYSDGLLRGEPAFIAALDSKDDPVRDEPRTGTDRAYRRTIETVKDVKKILGKYYKF